MKPGPTTEFAIANRKVGYQHPPLVIVEIGINHEGSLETAKTMVDSAKQAGAEIIKHQTHIVDDEMSSKAKSVVPGNANVSIYEIMERCALNENDEIALKEYVESQGMIFISTPFSRAAADRLQKMNIPAYKIGSGECNNLPLVDHVASFGKPMIISTGMNSIDDIKKTVSIVKKHEVPYALLHCTNVYPTPPELIRLGALTELQENFPDAVIGLSDHSLNNYACLGSVALGASILERHFTDSKERPGPDIVCSMTPNELTELINGSSEIQKARGGKKGPIQEEKVTINFAFSSVTTIAPVKKGEVFTKNNLWVKRPGTGEFLAESYENLLGKISNRDLPSDHQLCSYDIRNLS